MTIDERAQLAEDIERAGNKRRDIAERARLSEDFDIAAAWETLVELDGSIAERITESGVTTKPGIKDE